MQETKKGKQRKKTTPLGVKYYTGLPQGLTGIKFRATEMNFDVNGLTMPA